MYCDDTADRAHLCLTEVVIEETHKRYIERSKLHYSPAPTRQAPEPAQLPNRTSSFIYTPLTRKDVTNNFLPMNSESISHSKVNAIGLILIFLELWICASKSKHPGCRQYNALFMVTEPLQFTKRSVKRSKMLYSPALTQQAHIGTSTVTKSYEQKKQT